MRLLHDWVLARIDEPKMQKGSIILVESGNVRTATVEAVGPDAASELEIGSRICFFRWNMEHKQGQQLGAKLKEIGDNLALVRISDILFTFTGNPEIE